MGITASQYNELLDGRVDVGGGVIEAVEVAAEDTFVIVDKRNLTESVVPDDFPQVIFRGTVDDTNWQEIESTQVLAPLAQKMRNMPVFAGFWSAAWIRDRQTTGNEATVRIFGPGPAFLVPSGEGKFVSRRRWWQGVPTEYHYVMIDGTWSLG